MKKLILTALLAPLSLFASLDEIKLVQYLQDQIDSISYQITHADQKDTLIRACQISYMTACCKILHEIETGKFEDGIRE